MLGKYLPAYTTALQSHFTLHYIDAFAGTGLCHIKVDGDRLMVPGSASIAIECIPHFDKMIFIEKSLRKVRALARLRDAVPDRDVTVIREDANHALPGCLWALKASRDRAIVFLDPFGMQVEWKTLEEIAATKLADLWYLFPLSGLYRQATKDAADIDEDKAAALSRIFGTEEWREAFYSPNRQQGLFWQTSDIRTADVSQMLAWVKRRLETIFPGVANPKVLYQHTETGKLGAPLFALFFAVSNPAPKAVKLALRIAEGVLKG
jgi:three-Cys-motif partner protein